MILLAAWSLWALVAQDETVILSGARILTGAGREYASGTIVVRAGKLLSVSESAEAPEGTKTIDLRGKLIIPGLVAGASALGLDGSINEDGGEVTPGIRMIDGIDPGSAELARARQAGVTAAFVGPGPRAVIGGLGGVIKTAGTDRASLTLSAEAALKGTIGPGPSQGNFPPRGTAATFFARRPTTRMGVAWEFRKAFQDARASAVDSPLRRVLDGTLPLRISASRGTDVETALQIAEELGVTPQLEEGQEAWKRADLLARRKVALFLRPAFAPASGASADTAEIRLDAFSVLLRAGVTTALLPPEESRIDGLRSALVFAVRHGATPAEALRAVTLTPAELLGVSRRLGSLEAGKDADLVVLSGEPHQASTRVERVMIDGRWVSGERTAP